MAVRKFQVMNLPNIAPLYATNEIIQAGIKRQVRDREVVSYTFLSTYSKLPTKKSPI